MNWENLTEKQKMEWYQEQWKKENPNFQKCELDFYKGHWILRVKGNWDKTTSATIKRLSDAEYKHKLLFDPNFVKRQQIHIDMEFPFKPKKPEGKKYRSVSCSVSYQFYDEILKFVNSHNMTINELLVMLLKKVVPNEK